MTGFAFFMDAGLLGLLAATVVLVFKLNVNLKHFKESRFEMEGLINRLTTNVERAEKAIAGLQVSARNSGSDIDKKIKESKFLSDELKFMNDAGNNLADRLEKLAQTNRVLIEKIQESGGVGPNTSHFGSSIHGEQTQKTHSTQNANHIQNTGFSIADKEFEDGLNALDTFEDEIDAHDSGAGFQSQAERDLFEALQKRKLAGGKALMRDDDAHSKILIGLMVFAAIAFGVRFSEMIQKLRTTGSIQAYASNTLDVSLSALETAAGDVKKTTGDDALKEQNAATEQKEQPKELPKEKQPDVKAESQGKPEIEVPSLGDAPSKSAQWKDSGDLEDDYSDVKIEMFSDLSKRRKDLEAKEKELVMREALLKATQAELEQKTDELTRIKTDIETLLKQQTDQENKRIESLVRIYEGMKAKDAARIFDSLEMDVLLQVVTKMSERKSAPILAAMNPDRARNVTILLAEQNKLPDLPALPLQ